MKKKIKIILISLAFALLLALLCLLTVNAYVKATARDSIISIDEAVKLEDVDCIITLGCLVRPDGNPSGMLSDRLTVALELWDRGVSDTLLMSGDHGTAEYDEVNVMRNVALEHGVPSERVFMDHAGFCTYDSIYRLKEVFGAKKVVIVTQKYHLYRALYIAEKLGIEAYGVSADLHEYRYQARNELREILARSKDFLGTALNAKPKYLGIPIDLKGDGNATLG